MKVHIEIDIAEGEKADRIIAWLIQHNIPHQVTLILDASNEEETADNNSYPAFPKT